MFMDRIQVQLLMDRIQMRACVDCIQMHQQSRGDTVLLLLVSGAMLLPIYIRPIYYAQAAFSYGVSGVVSLFCPTN